ncbi:hypothetical protein KC19_VG077700 [Ceratodon purpureus]|uniref:Uncharacterized protein n=1 Tax=Ceratodon purpureus TaxID=3225 RepID=A0A8T0HN32_CERPU|nr:hypothetical protein KC19_VG077700 [Ceratodon purpureus]
MLHPYVGYRTSITKLELSRIRHQDVPVVAARHLRLRPRIPPFAQTPTTSVTQEETDTIATLPRMHPHVVPDGKTVNLNARAMNGLMQVRSGIGAVVQKKRISLKEALHTESLALKDRHRKISEEKERAKFVA